MPLTERQKLQLKYYSAKTKYATIEQARDLTRKLPKYHNSPREYGNICKIELDGREPFYAVHYFPKWADSGAVLGMWNEITLIERL